jgi:carboxymethylenebutenolidase
MARITTTEIDFAGDENTVHGYVARPDDNETHSGIIVVHGDGELNDHVKDIAQRIARVGFVALVPSLSGGKVTDGYYEPHESTKHPGKAEDLMGALKWLQNVPDVHPNKIGIMDFGTVGSAALVFASRVGPEVGAVVSYYGSNYDPTEDDISKILCPILIFYGGKDQSIPESTRDRLRKYLTDQGKRFDQVVYPNAGHEFFNDTAPKTFDQHAATDAWQRAIRWFNTYLR